MQTSRRSREVEWVPGMHIATQVLRNTQKEHSEWRLRFYPRIINSWQIPRQKAMLFLAYNSHCRKMGKICQCLGAGRARGKQCACTCSHMYLS